MARRYWLMKTEPEAYSFEDLVREGSTEWDGVRNYQARNNMREMSVDDLVLIYHSVGPKSFVGVALNLDPWGRFSFLVGRHT